MSRVTGKVAAGTVVMQSDRPPAANPASTEVIVMPSPHRVATLAPSYDDCLRALMDDLRQRLARVCSDMPAPQFGVLIEQMARRALRWSQLDDGVPCLPSLALLAAARGGQSSR